MEGSLVFSCSSSSLKTHFKFNIPSSYCHCYSSTRQCQSLNMNMRRSFIPKKEKRNKQQQQQQVLMATSLPTSAFVIEKALHNSSSSSTKDKDISIMPKIDKTGRFCSPRAARELALMIIYAACLEGSDPIRLFEKRMNARREPGYQFDKASLLEYNHMSFGGPPVTTETVEEADELLRSDEKESAIEAEVLSAPPKLVYSRLLLRFTRKLLVAVVDKWDSHVLVIDKVSPANWKSEPAGRILEFCILHLAMSEIDVLETRHQIVINEAVDLAKRFCDGAAPRIINGCLRTFVRDLSGANVAQGSDANQNLEA